MTILVAWFVSIGIIGGLASAVLRPSAQPGTRLIFGGDVNGVRLAGRVQTPLLGLSRRAPGQFYALGGGGLLRLGVLRP